MVCQGNGAQPKLVFKRSERVAGATARHRFGQAGCVLLVSSSGCEKLGLPVVTYADAPVAYESRVFNEEKRWHPPGLVEAIEKWGLKQSTSVITVSHPAKRQLDRYRVRAPIHVISNGVDAKRFDASATPDRALLKRELNLIAPTVIGFQGTFRAFHGIDRLRELMLSLANEADVQWLLIGDGPEREAIEQAVRGKVSVRFLGRRPPGEMADLLSVVDIAVAPHAQMKGDFYFCPLKILEYGASGCATVASRQGDIPRLLADGTAGVIVASDELPEWTAAVRNLIQQPALCAELGRKAREYVLRHLTWEQTARGVEQVLMDACVGAGYGQRRPDSNSVAMT